MNKSEKSDRLFSQAREHLVGGVNSPVRAFGAVGGSPRFIQQAKGATLTDVDGNAYIDFVGSWGPMILGHNAPPVIKAVKKALARGTSFGAPTEVETEVAKLVKEAVPSIELIRFTSSGTEATMSAIRLARAFTKRDRLVKFEGCYHGHSDSLLVAAGSGATTFGVPSSAGVPEFLARNTWVIPYNNLEALRGIFRTQGPNIAAVIIEPVAGNMGVVIPSGHYLKELQALARQHGSLLIADEVMTGFRLAWGGAQELFNIEPDLTCFGKIIGGGFPVGAFGGRADVMKLLAPLGPVYQAGTLSGNPIAMNAGLAALKTLKAKKPYKELEKRTRKLADSIRRMAAERKLTIQVNQIGSMFTVFFSDMPVTNYFSAVESDTKRYAVFFHALLDNGVYFPPSQFESAFVSLAHTPTVLNETEKRIARAFDQMSVTL